MAGTMLVLGCLVIIIVAIYLSVDYGDQPASIFTVLALIAILIGLNLVDCKWFYGQPKNEIKPGIHKIAFIYRAGEYTTIGVEEVSNANPVGGLVVYQFPSKEFVDKVPEGVNPDSGKLQLRHFKITDGSGKHNVYELVPRPLR